MSTRETSQRIRLLDLHPTADAFCEDVRRGLTSPRRKLPPKYFYDDRGAELFERITTLDEYYLTRTEAAIFDEHMAEIAARIGAGVRVVEFGSGSGIKTRTLLRHLDAPVAYIPIDISRAQLMMTAARVAEEFSDIDVLPVCADYTRDLRLPESDPAARTLAFFPGSTIGNFEYPQARAFLAHVARICGDNGQLLIGADLHKDTDTIERAYNDSVGVTAEFNLNLLDRINRECGADFDRANFAHTAVYDEARHRIEMRIVCTRAATVALPALDNEPALRIDFSPGEYIVTEYSHKYSQQEFAGLVQPAGWRIDSFWTDAGHRFGVWLLARQR